MDNSNTNKEESIQIQTALGVTEDRNRDRENGKNEQTQSFRRRGRADSILSEPNIRGGETLGQVRVIISQEASRYLDELAAKVNDGFDAGKVTRSQILNWVIRRFAEAAGEEEITELRTAHFDRIAYLEALLRRAKETGSLPPELQAVLQPPSAQAHSPKKAKRLLTKNTINDDTANDSNES